jgi:hypothetical protein
LDKSGDAAFIVSEEFIGEADSISMLYSLCFMLLLLFLNIGAKQKSRKLVASDFLIETKPQEPLLAALLLLNYSANDSSCCEISNPNLSSSSFTRNGMILSVMIKRI